MTTFDDREHAYETKFAHDADLRFRAEARRNRLLGEWAAGLLGKTGDEARTYALTVVTSDFEEPGEDDVLRKLLADLDGKAAEDEIRAKMAELLGLARQQRGVVKPQAERRDGPVSGGGTRSPVAHRPTAPDGRRRRPGDSALPGTPGEP